MSPTIGAERWAQVLATFEEIVELDDAAREDRLESIGTGDPDLQRAVEDLLAADATADTRLARLDVALGSAASHRDRRARDGDPLKLVGRTVSHFRVIEPLAQGGMGIVYRAEDTRLGRAVALKFPLAVDQLDRHVKERFLHEAQLAGALDHPNLCGIYEAGATEDGHLFHAMPLYGGETLRTRLAREGALPIADALAIAKQIAHGLSAAHRAGIVHRDLKPANVMLLPDGTVKLLDFGLARAKDLSLTAPRTAVGTVSYMAPEQVLGRRVDGRADLWALGVVLYEMLTGKRPFDGEEVGTIAHAIVHTEPVMPRALRADIPGEVAGVVRTLLTKDPGRRSASAEDVATALAVIQIGKPVPLGVSVRLGRKAWWRDHVGARTTVFAALVVTALGMSAWLASRGGASPPAPRLVAVLPFDDLSEGGDARHIAMGVSDAIGMELSRLRAVVVPSRVSTAAYRATSRAPSEIASVLGASAVVTGTVRRAGDRLQFDIQLFDARSNKWRWEERYERPVGGVEDVQRDAARAIVSALRVPVTDAERARLARPLTMNGQAYELYLRARAVELENLPRNLGASMPAERVRTAVALYSQARATDPNFGVARGRLAIMLMRAAVTYDTMQARQETARLEAETALRLEPGLWEAHAALAAYWRWGGRDVAKEIEEFEAALKGAPNSADLHVQLADAFRRAGRWEDAIAAYERAMLLDPHHPIAPMQAALTYLRLRRDAEAMRAFDRAIALAPNDHMIKVIKGHTYLRWRGTPDTLAVVLRSVPVGWDPNGMTTWARYTVLRVQRRYAAALAMLDSSGSTLSRDGLVYQPSALMRAQSHEALGEHAKARAHYEAARAMLVDSAAAHPANASIRATLGLVHAALGNKRDALREARYAMELVPPTRSNIASTAFMGIAVEVFGRAGEIDAAFELLELLLAMPAGREVTVPFLRIWPGFDPLRADPRFDQLLARFVVN